MDKASVLKIASQFQKGLEASGIRPHKMILYGSFASGADREGSDINLVVISDDFNGKDYWERIDIMADVIYEIFAPIEAVALTQAEWDQGDLFITDFARNGEVLFAA